MNKMTRRIPILLVALGLAGYALFVIHRGFSALDQPTALEKFLARTVRHISVPPSARRQKNPWQPTSQILQQAQDDFRNRCAGCHSFNGSGQTPIGRDLYPKVPDLRLATTQNLSDGELHYIIENGVRLTGMPAWANPHDPQGDTSWKLVLFIRRLRGLSSVELADQAALTSSAKYVGSVRCQKCHGEIYARWKKTPMANVVHDPREHPDAILPDLVSNTIAPFSRDDVALVYGSIWKQRYFTRKGDDYFPEPAQWDISHKVWRPYFVPNSADWWAPLYPPDNMQRPTGPTCDGCHSVNYDIRTRQVTEWNVGCERCHGPGSLHVEHPSRANILNPAHMDPVQANDTCIQCHSQGRPLRNPIDGRYYDWPVGYQVGLPLQNFWMLEGHMLGQTTFTHFPDGTAHKNRMQGNDFVQSLMYRRGITCFDCHDVHGTSNYAQLRKPPGMLCLDCHGPASPNGPHAATLEAHTHHKPGSAGSQCIACHMPKVAITLADVKVRSHTFAFIPPSSTQKYAIPNPCTECHRDKTPAWATDALLHWSGQSPWRIE